MSNFIAKCIGPRWGNLQRSSDPRGGFKGPTSRGRQGKGGKEGHGDRGREKGEMEGRRGEPSSSFIDCALICMCLSVCT